MSNHLGTMRYYFEIILLLLFSVISVVSSNEATLDSLSYSNSNEHHVLPPSYSPSSSEEEGDLNFSDSEISSTMVHTPLQLPPPPPPPSPSPSAPTRVTTPSPTSMTSKLKNPMNKLVSKVSSVIPTSLPLTMKMKDQRKGYYSEFAEYGSLTSSKKEENSERRKGTATIITNPSSSSSNSQEVTLSDVVFPPYTPPLNGVTPPAYNNYSDIVTLQSINDIIRSKNKQHQQQSSKSPSSSTEFNDSNTSGSSSFEDASNSKEVGGGGGLIRGQSSQEGSNNMSGEQVLVLSEMDKVRKEEKKEKDLYDRLYRLEFKRYHILDSFDPVKYRDKQSGDFYEEIDEEKLPPELENMIRESQQPIPRHQQQLPPQVFTGLPYPRLIVPSLIVKNNQNNHNMVSKFYRTPLHVEQPKQVVYTLSTVEPSPSPSPPPPVPMSIVSAAASSPTSSYYLGGTGSNGGPRNTNSLTRDMRMMLASIFSSQPPSPSPFDSLPSIGHHHHPYHHHHSPHHQLELSIPPSPPSLSSSSPSSPQPFPLSPTFPFTPLKDVPSSSSSSSSPFNAYYTYSTELESPYLEANINYFNSINNNNHQSENSREEQDTASDDDLIKGNKASASSPREVTSSSSEQQSPLTLEEEEAQVPSNFLQASDVIRFLQERKIEYVFHPLEESPEYQRIRSLVPEDMFTKLNGHLGLHHRVDRAPGSLAQASTTMSTSTTTVKSPPTQGTRSRRSRLRTLISGSTFKRRKRQTP